jgi:hypothetical protein
MSLFTNQTIEVQNLITKQIGELSNYSGINPNYFLFLYYCESGLNPYQPNPNGTAYGLWQLTQGTATGLGIDFAKYKASGWNQISYQLIFLKYWKKYLSKVNSFGELYLFNFTPAYFDKLSTPFSDTISNANNLKAKGIYTPLDWIQYWNVEYKAKYKDNIDISKLTNEAGMSSFILLLLLGGGLYYIAKNQ